jgi:hypothetical protein
MRTRRNVAGTLVATVAALALMGCVQSPPHVIPTSDPSTKPVFASDAAALAAAKKAYVAYLAVSDQVAHDGGDGIDRLRPWVSGAQFKRDAKSLATMKAQGHHTTGASSFSNVSLESSETVNGTAAIVAYICLQIGDTQLLDSSGTNVGANRPLALPLEVSFVSSSAQARSLVVDRSVGWSGADFCS